MNTDRAPEDIRRPRGGRARPFGPLLPMFQRFFRLQSAGGIVLLGATLLALAWANSPLGASYERLWQARLAVGYGAFRLDKDLIHWVNDGLMAIFFLLVGLEIKRELLAGELSDRRRATLPFVAALGGMLVPASIFIFVTRGTPVVGAWGIPMATDIAFALGALAALGSRVPTSLRVFLAATAIVDDIGAVLVIALVYTPSVGAIALLAAAGVLVVLGLLNRLGVTRIAPYALLGVALWIAILKSGVHASVAGVLLAFAIPARMRGEARAVPLGGASPLLRLEHALVPWVAFGIVPVFALANAGVRIEGDLAAALTSPLSVGIVVGLLAGKLIGILAFPWLAVRLRLTALPTGASWRHMTGVALLAAIGFTMSLFIAGLALEPADLARGKLAILVASTLAAVSGSIVLAWPRARRT
ncbi:MAG TPA: Na+/H+ antiporter NhaA [Candidatus Thermoplasmatota archaeon]|nr:Na+/H+ antiporter NhaA [Candidatus Thermoplasmatota archaeon]